MYRLRFLYLFFIGWPVFVYANATPPRLVVIIVGDQVRADYLERYRAYLSPHGLRLFLEKGTYFSHARMDHANTRTAPGHALIGSGLYPYQNGIISNEWYDRASQKIVTASEQIPDAGRVRLKWFIGMSLAERVHHAYPKSRVIGISLKDRGALLLAGSDQNDAYWWDKNKRKFMGCQSAFDWLDDFNAGTSVYLTRYSDWSPAVEPQPILSSALRKQADLTASHICSSEIGNSFPHPIKSMDALLETPFADTMVNDLAMLAIRSWHLGENPNNEPDVLTISFSAVDLIGHQFGPDSEEVMDAIIRLDRCIATLISFIESRNAGKVLYVFTSDHGSTPFPEIARSNGFPAARVQIDKKTLGHSGIKAISLPYIYLDPVNGNLSDVKKMVEKIDGVAGVYTAEDVKARRAPEDVRKSFYLPPTHQSARGGDLYVTLKPHYIFDEKHLTGTTHGQPTDDDQRIPLGFYGIGVVDRTIDGETSISRAAPTILKQLGIPAPELQQPLSLE